MCVLWRQAGACSDSVPRAFGGGRGLRVARSAAKHLRPTTWCTHCNPYPCSIRRQHPCDLPYSAKDAKAEKASTQHRVSELELLLAQARAASAPAVASPERPTRETAPGEEKADGERGEEEGEGRKDGGATPHSPNSTSVELMALQVR